MKLCMFGVRHASPICRNRYCSKISHLLREKGLPSFLAVEAGPQLYRDVVLPQREEFRALAMDDPQFTCYGASFVDALSECILFEADAHKQVYGSQEPAILWLDEPCDWNAKDQGASRGFGRNHYIWFKSFLGKQVCPTVEEAMYCIHSELGGNDKPIDPISGTYDRDEKWNELIRMKIQEASHSTYAIVIVGRDHIENDPLSIFSLLSGSITCEAFDLTKS